MGQLFRTVFTSVVLSSRPQIRYPLMSEIQNLCCHVRGEVETMAEGSTDTIAETGDQIQLVDRHNNNKVCPRT